MFPDGLTPDELRSKSMEEIVKIMGFSGPYAEKYAYKLRGALKHYVILSDVSLSRQEMAEKAGLSFNTVQHYRGLLTSLDLADKKIKLRSPEKGIDDKEFLEYVKGPRTIEDLMENMGFSKYYICKRVGELSKKELLRKQNFIHLGIGTGSKKYRRKDLLPGMPNVYVFKPGQEEMMADIVIFYISADEFLEDISSGKKHSLTSCLQNSLPKDLFEIIYPKYSCV